MGHAEIIKSIVEFVANGKSEEEAMSLINQETSTRGQTAMHLLASSNTDNDTAIVEIFLKYHADPNCRIKETDETFLHLVTRFNQIRILEYVLEHLPEETLQLNTQTKTGDTALMEACKFGNSEIVSFCSNLALSTIFLISPYPYGPDRPPWDGQQHGDYYSDYQPDFGPKFMHRRGPPPGMGPRFSDMPPHMEDPYAGGPPPGHFGPPSGPSPYPPGHPNGGQPIYGQEPYRDDKYSAPGPPQQQQPLEESQGSKRAEYGVERPFDSVIVVTSKNLKHYAEMVERRLLELNMVVDMIFILNEKALNKAIDDMACRGVLYIIVIQQQHEEHKAITANIMHGTPQEHRNMPLEDALVMLARDFNGYLSSLRCGSEQPTMGFLLNLLAHGKHLSVAELDRILTHLQDRRDRLIEAEGGRKASIIRAAKQMISIVLLRQMLEEFKIFFHSYNTAATNFWWRNLVDEDIIKKELPHFDRKIVKKFEGKLNKVVHSASFVLNSRIVELDEFPLETRKFISELFRWGRRIGIKQIFVKNLYNNADLLKKRRDRLRESYRRRTALESAIRPNSSTNDKRENSDSENVRLTDVVLVEAVTKLRDQRYIDTDLADLLATVESNLRDSFCKTLKSKPVIDLLGQSCGHAVAEHAQATYKHTFQSIIAPSFETASKALFTQINEIFRGGTAEYLDQLQKQVNASRSDTEEIRTSLNSHFNTLSEQLKTNVDKQLNRLSQVVQSHVEKSVQQNLTKQLDDRLASVVKSVVKDELKKALNENQLNDVVLKALRSQTATPSPAGAPQTDRTALLKDITAAISQNNYAVAFQQALNALDLSLLTYVCNKISPTELFSIVPCPLSQAVILSLIQQLSNELDSQTDLKLKYLTEAVTSIDVRNIQAPNHQQNVNRVIVQLERNLESFAATPAAAPFSRLIKILMTAAQSLTK